MQLVHLLEIRLRSGEKEMGNRLPIMKVHFGTCDCCRRKNILVVHFNYHIQPEEDFRLCNRCYVKGQMVGMVKDNLLEINNAEAY